MDDYQKLKRRLVEQRGFVCEAQEFWPHVCEPKNGLEAHHVLFSRRKSQGNSALRKYADHPINVALVCQRAHDRLGHSRQFRAWWRDSKAPELYGPGEVAEYVRGWPGRVMV